MAHPGIATTFTGDSNLGLQVGYNTGSVETHIHPPERPESPPQPSCFIPFRRDRDFVDRAALLDQIQEQCSAPASRVALVGLGGVGKSQLAIEYCYRTVDQSPNTWVFWAHASNIARLEQSYRDIADLLKVRGRKDSHADVFKLVHNWLCNEKNGPWLFVLDNADDAAVLSPQSVGSGALRQHLSNYLPPSRHGSVLVTSRTRRAAMQVVEDSEIIAIEPMNTVAAHALLCKKLRHVGSGSDEDIAELATTLDYMPLALVQAAAYISARAPRCSVRQYLEEYQMSDSKKTSLLNQEAGHLRRDEEASNSVITTWQISFDHVRSTRRSAADLLSLMSFFDRQGIQEALLKTNDGASAVSSNDSFEDDVLTLRDYSFVTFTRDEKVFEMHNLVQLATRKWLENHGQLDKWREQFIFNLCAELPNGNYENWAKCQALFPHAQAALAQTPQSEKSLKRWADLLYKAAWYAWNRGRADEVEHMSRMAMEVRRELYGEESVKTLSSMGMVANASILRGKYEEAHAILRQNLAISERVLGFEHPDTLTSMNDLAMVLLYEGKYQEAKVMQEQTLLIYKKALSSDHPKTLKSMNNLATTLAKQGKYKEAEEMHRQTLLISKKVLGSDHPKTLTSMNNLATVLKREGRYQEAEIMCKQTLVLREKVLGSDHPDTLTTMSNLAAVLVREGSYQEAEVMVRQNLAISERVLGSDHPNTLISVYQLAYLFAKQHRYSESFDLYKRACAGLETVRGKDHPDTRSCRQDYNRAKMDATIARGPAAPLS